MREEWNFPEMQHFAVKVVCKDDSGHETIGSGTVVVDDGHFYVLTAGHCICYKTDEDYVLDFYHAVFGFKRNAASCTENCNL